MRKAIAVISTIVILAMTIYAIDKIINQPMETIYAPWLMDGSIK